MTNEILASVLAFLHTLAASFVTLHVLIHHRDVRSSFGWIGLAWLSPILGSFIYYAFGINRVMRRGTKISWTLNGNGQHKVPSSEKLLHDAAQVGALGSGVLDKHIITIADAGDHITCMPLTVGNAIDLLENGDQGYPAMLEAINGAKRSLALASFLFADDRVGRVFIEALIAAHQRGVQIRVLFDGVGGGYLRCKAHERLKEAGVPTAIFLHEWLPWKMSFINLRNHKKILVADGKIGFTGGLNIREENVTQYGNFAVQDTHARLEGPIVAHLLLAFARDWDYAHSEPLIGADWWPPLAVAGQVAMRGINSGPDQSVGRIEDVWATAIEQAESTIRILTPYFLPEDRILALLRRAAMRGVKIELIVPEYTNHFYINWAFRAHMDGFPLDRIHCYLTPGPFDHSKLMTIDGVWCAFGSPNWDARSMRLNFEFMVECYSQDAARALDRIMARKKSGAKRLTSDVLKHRPTWQKLRDSSARLFLPYL